MILKKTLLSTIVASMFNCGNAQHNTNNSIDTMENQHIIKDSLNVITQEINNDTKKLIYFFNKTDDEIRDYEGDNFSFMAGLGSLYGNSYESAIETGEALEGVGVSIASLYGYEDDFITVNLYYGNNDNIVSRISTELNKSQYDIFLTSEVSALNLKKVKEDIGKEQQKKIFTNEKFIFVLTSHIFHGNFSADLAIYSIKEQAFALNLSNEVSKPNR